MDATITAKGQMTLPKASRDHLRVQPGDRVKVFNLPDGTVVILPRRPITALRGLLKSPFDRPVTIEEMNEGIAAGAESSLGIRPNPGSAKLNMTRRKRRK